MALTPVILLVPSQAAAVELPRRLASTGRAIAGFFPFKVLDLARVIAEPALLGRGLKAWDFGHDALLAARLLDDVGGPWADLPRGSLASALARSLSALRRAGLLPERVERLAMERDPGSADAFRLQTVARLYRGFHRALEGRFVDPPTLLRAAAEHLGQARWLQNAQVLVDPGLELDPLESEFLAALAKAHPTRVLRRQTIDALPRWAEKPGIGPVALAETLLAPITDPTLPAGLLRLREQLFSAPLGVPVSDSAVALLTGPGEAAEVRAIVRRLLREAARGVAFEEMGVILPRPQEYAPLFADLLDRLEIPHRLHPSLPLRFGRAARSLLLLFRCRGLPRSAVMEFVTFAPIPFAELLGPDRTPRPAQWDALSRDAKIVSGFERWMIGLRAQAETERDGAATEKDDERRDRRRRRAEDAESLLQVVEVLSATLDALAGEADWPEWSLRLKGVLDQWVGPESDREAVSEVIADLAGLCALEARAPWSRVQEVIEARFEWERMPLAPLSQGAIHVGALDAMAGLPFRVVAIPGLVEGGYPGVFRPDPFLLDAEREALMASAGAPPPPALIRKAPPRAVQLALFEAAEPPEPAPPAPPDASERLLPTTQDRLQEARRLFQRAVSQAQERLILSYPRADPRSGRERLPSLFLVAAASALAGRPVSTRDLDLMVEEDDPDALALEDALDPGERDRFRVRRGGREATLAIAAGSLFFRHSHLASEARWSNRLSPYDGLVAPLPEGLAGRLDPTAGQWAVSASRLATYARCGFQYLLQYVLRLAPALEPEERKRLDPLERGSLFHEVAERFLRERREKGELPIADTPEMRARALAVADERLAAFVEDCPPRFAFLWEKEKQKFRSSVLSWLEREVDAGERAIPAYFEVSFGLGRQAGEGEPHASEPLEISLGEGRVLRVSGQIDRIDRRPEGGLLLRDYKTGKAPKDDGGVFRGGKQLQIPFYILAAARLFPGEPVVEAFLDYVDGGRQVALDPTRVTGEEFRSLLRSLVDLIAQGVFAQEPSSCDFCDFKVVCGPKGLLERRRQHKIGDRLLQRVLRLRDIA
ncbi:MAG TPA: PD-(D/E)XK nuclease family protein [Vicinamibacteria bacterium]|nr:PD-(D/E)XK nuclease family protein [Vicinamibacteria bacterium]